MNKLLPARTAREVVASAASSRFTQMETSEEAQAMAEIAKRLQTRYAQAGERAIEELVTELHHHFDGNPIRDFVPVLVEREAVERLERNLGRKSSLSA